MHNPRQSRINSASRTVLISPTNRDWDLQAITRRIGQSDWRAASVNAEGPVTHTRPPMFNHPPPPSPRSTPSRAIVRRAQNQCQHRRRVATGACLYELSGDIAIEPNLEIDLTPPLLYPLFRLGNRGFHANKLCN